MKLNQFALYQIRNDSDMRKYRFKHFEDLRKLNIPVKASDYGQVYISAILPSDTPKSICERFQQCKPKSFMGHSISTSDVLAVNKQGVTTAYYIDGNTFIALTGFFKSAASGTLVSMESTGYHIEGKSGTWMAVDEIIVDGSHFLLMENEKYGTQVKWSVISENGKIAAEDTNRGFDETTMKQIRSFLHPDEKENPAPAQKPKLEVYQQYYENGEYLRTTESGTEQNYDMIDGRANNQKPVEEPRVINGRVSVMDRLRIKQAARKDVNNTPQRDQMIERDRK